VNLLADGRDWQGKISVQPLVISVRVPRILATLNGNRKVLLFIRNPVSLLAKRGLYEKAI